MQKQLNNSEIAIVHEWFVNYAGSERVVEQMLLQFPQASLHALIDTLEGNERYYLHGKSVATSFISRLPFARKHFRNYLPLFPLAIEQLDVRHADVVLSSSHLVAKGVLTAPHQLHVSYCHSPVRYAYDLYLQYLEESNLTRGIKGALARYTLHRLRQWDYISAQRVDKILANSHYIANRIQKVWRRDSEVVYPPVATHKFLLQSQKDDYYFTAARLVPYKKVDLIVQAFAEMPNKKLIVAGDGPMIKQVKAAMKPNITLLPHVPFSELVQLMQNAKAFVFAAEEDFGITLVEAQAAGTPVIAFGKGGATETVISNKTGLLFGEQTVNSIIHAVQHFEQIQTSFSAEEISLHASLFSEQHFRNNLNSVIDKSYNEFQKGAHFA